MIELFYLAFEISALFRLTPIRAGNGSELPQNGGEICVFGVVEAVQISYLIKTCIALFGIFCAHDVAQFGFYAAHMRLRETALQQICHRLHDIARIVELPVRKTAQFRRSIIGFLQGTELLRSDQFVLIQKFPKIPHFPDHHGRHAQGGALCLIFLFEHERLVFHAVVCNSLCAARHDVIDLAIAQIRYIYPLSAIHAPAQLREPKIELVAVQSALIVFMTAQNGFALLQIACIFAALYLAIKLAYPVVSALGALFIAHFRGVFQINVRGRTACRFDYFFKQAKRVPHAAPHHGRQAQIFDVFFIRKPLYFLFLAREFFFEAVFLAPQDLIDMQIGFKHEVQNALAALAQRAKQRLARIFTPAGIILFGKFFFMIRKNFKRFYAFFAYVDIVEHGEHAHDLFARVKILFNKLLPEHLDKVDIGGHVRRQLFLVGNAAHLFRGRLHAEFFYHQIGDIRLFHALALQTQRVYRLFLFHGDGFFAYLYLVDLIERHIFLIEHGIEGQRVFSFYQNAIVGHADNEVFRQLVQTLLAHDFAEIPRP